MSKKKSLRVRCADQPAGFGSDDLGIFEAGESLMTIRQQVDDAIFLDSQGRHLGALTILMIAIAASARRCFPRGTASIRKPAENMRDEESFTLFLGGRISRIILGDDEGPEFSEAGICLPFRDGSFDLAYLLYKFYRCELVHEGELPSDVEFDSTAGNEHSARIGFGDKLVLNRGWIRILVEAVADAPCNGDEFGRQHFVLQAKHGADLESVKQDIMDRFHISGGRYGNFRRAVRLIGPDEVTSIDDETLGTRFRELVAEGSITGGAITGLVHHGLADWDGTLRAPAFAIIREIAQTHEVVPWHAPSPVANS